MFVGASLLAACGDGSKPGIYEIDIGVDVRVNAIVAVHQPEGLGLFAAVSGGAIVDQDGQRWQLSSHELWALATDQFGRHWVCGDRGYLAFADVDKSGTEPIWTPVDLGIEADQ
jgi:hypothetical protein